MVLIKKRKLHKLGGSYAILIPKSLVETSDVLDPDAEYDVELRNIYI